MTATSAFLANSDAALTQLHTGSFSLVGWYRPKASAPFVPTTLILAPAWKLVLNTDGTLTVTIKDSVTGIETPASSIATVIEDWNFVGVLYDLSAKKLTLILNGDEYIASFTDAADSSLSAYTTGFQLGANDRMDSAGGTDASFDLDDIGIWGRLLSDLEIDAIFANGPGNAYPYFGGAFNLVFQGDVIGASEPIVAASDTSLWSVTPLYDSSTQQYEAAFSLLFTGNKVSRGFSWTADNFSNKLIFAQHDNRAKYWLPETTIAYDLPGLPVGDAQWDGTMSFYNHVLLWKGDRLKWSDIDDFSIWIPVATTAVSAALTLAEDFIQPAPGGNVSVTVINPVAEVKSISLEGDLNFDSLAVGSTDTLLLTILNTGTSPLTVTGVSCPAGFSGSFAGVLPVGGSAPVVITFAPTAAVSYDGAITVASDATDGTSSISVTGTGTGLTKTLAISGVLAFGNVVTGKTVTSSLVLQNTGTATVTVSSLLLPAGFSGAFSGTIAPGATHAVTITFSPSAALTYSGNIVVTSDATGSGSYPVSGTGVTSLGATVFMSDNGTLQFGDVPDGTTVTGTLRIWNTGNTAFNVVGLTLPAGFSGSFSGTVAAYGYVDVTIGFSPVDPITYSGLITAAFNITVGGVNTLLISGTGTASGKVISLTGNLAFGEVPTGGSVQALLKISNIGTVALTVTSIAYPTGFSGSYSGTISPGTTKSVLVSFAPTAAISYSGNLTVNSDATVTAATFPLSGTGFDLPQPVALVEGQFVSLIDARGAQTYYNFYEVVSMSNTSLVLQLLDLTGATPASLTLAADGRQFFTLDANEAGEATVTGAQMNGNILRVIQLGDYAYIFKSRSVQSLQYTGLGNGTFFIHREITEEGLLTAKAVVNRGDGSLVFLGHKELYVYAGGPTPTPVCRQTTQQLFTELDRSRLDAVALFHHENAHEVWVKYPVSGGFRVLIWNYVEDSSTLDDYDASAEFTAMSLIDWTADVVWAQVAPSVTWASLDARAWEDWSAAGVDHVPVLASQDGNLRIFGQVYDRDGAGYLSVSETMDYDFQNPDIWKYVDTVVLGLKIDKPVKAGTTMSVQVGSRPSLNTADEDIVWTAAKSVLVDGTAPVPLKVNPGGAGRYLRLRFFSSDPDVKWQVSSFEIHCRPGGLY